MLCFRIHDLINAAGFLSGCGKTLHVQLRPWASSHNMGPTLQFDSWSSATHGVSVMRVWFPTHIMSVGWWFIILAAYWKVVGLILETESMRDEVECCSIWNDDTGLKPNLSHFKWVVVVLRDYIQYLCLKWPTRIYSMHYCINAILSLHFSEILFYLHEICYLMTKSTWLHQATPAKQYQKVNSGRSGFLR